MLDFLRKRKRNWAILFLLVLIIIVFVAFYGGNKIGDRTTSEVAMLNGEPISQREFAAEYQRTVERYREMLKRQLTEEMLKGLNLKCNLVETLVQKKLVLQEAQSLGLMAHPYDISTLLVAQEAGAIITDTNGKEIKYPLDTKTDCGWIGYANESIKKQVEPVLLEEITNLKKI